MPKEYLTPNEINALRYYIDADLGKGLDNYNENNKRFGIEGAFKSENKKPILMRLSGCVETDGIQVGDWKLKKDDGTDMEGQYYWFSLGINEERDEEALDKMGESLVSFLEDNNELEGFDADDWTVVNPQTNGKVRIKMKVTGGKFDARINGAKFNVTQVDKMNEAIEIDTPVEVLAEIQPYFKFKDQAAGYNIIVRKVVFNCDIEAPIFSSTPKKRKAVKSVSEETVVEDLPTPPTKPAKKVKPVV
jgi:hypothetical protein